MKKVAVIIVILGVLIYSLNYTVDVLIGYLWLQADLSPRDEYDNWRYAVSDAPQSLAPQWLPDGSRIVFTKLNNPEDVWLYGVTSDGSRLWSVSKDMRWPSISPDGSRIAYGATRDHQRLPYYIESVRPNMVGLRRLLNIRDVRQLTEQALKDAPPGLNDVSPSWSPDGQRIAFARFSLNYTEGGGIFVMDADGSNLSQLFRFRTGREGDTVADGYRWGPVWSPDGERLAFVVQQYSRDGIYGYVERYVLYNVKPDGSELTRAFTGTLGQQVYPGGIAIDRILGPPAWSPDGSKLAIVRSIRSDHKDYFAGEAIEEPPGSLLNTVDSDGSRLRTVVEGLDIRSLGALSWSPSGTDILFTSAGVYIANADDGSYRKIIEGSYAS